MSGEPERFAPWAVGAASRDSETGAVVGTISLRADSGLRIVSAEVHGDGQFLTCVFEEVASS